MTTRKTLFRCGATLFAGLFVLFPYCSRAAQGAAAADETGTLHIRMRHADKAEMPPARFNHDAHAARVREAGKDCTVCHALLGSDKADPQQALAVVPAGVKDDKDDLKEAWHRSCFTCHEKADDAPGAASCRACHDPAPATANRLPVRFDRALHAVHVHSTRIPVVQPQNPSDAPVGNCGACHTVTEPATGRQVYVQGTEDARSFHKSDLPAGSERAFATHSTCVECHVRAEQADKSLTLPVNCADCHGAAAQARFPANADAPRLLRGQPDVIMLGTEPAEEAVAASEGGLKPVPFNHKSHEQAVACGVCHGPHIAERAQGAPAIATAFGPDGTPLSAFEAAHSTASDVSCVGCHKDRAAAQRTCAGCHADLAFKAPDSCSVCHRGNAPAPAAKTVPLADVPETVTIGALADEYKPAEFPHRKIWLALSNGMGDSALAASFHTDAACGACHHNSPADTLSDPPACASCHARGVGAVDAHQPPRLKAAYHQMCMSCHTTMNVRPAAADCSGCHAPAAGPDASKPEVR